MAVALATDGRLSSPDALTRVWSERIKEAREDRKRYEPTWLSNLAFAAGKHYLMWDRMSRSLVLPQQLEQQMARGELYTADVITERRMRMLSELSAGDDLPDLLLVDDGKLEEDYQAQANRGVRYAWDYEARGDETLLDLRRKVVDLGTAAIRCYFDPTAGPVKADQVPFHQGKPVLDPQQATELLGQGPRADVQMRQIHEGRIRLETLSPFNLLVPAGIEHERDFPWEIVVRPVPLSKLQQQYGNAADGLSEDNDIGSILGLDSRSESEGRGVSPVGGSQARLRGHVWRFICYQRPTGQHPNGRVVTLASNKHQLLDVTDQLPYVGPDGTRRSGLSYFHFWRVTGRFWSRSMIEPMKDPQRSINKRKTQISATIDRGQAYLVVEEGSKAAKREGVPVEVLEIGKNETPPLPVSGIPVGQWMYQDIESSREDLDHASGIGAASLGENPANVQTYAQLAQLAGQESSKRDVILTEHRLAVGQIVENIVCDIRAWWGPEKQILLDSDDDRVEAQTFNATKLPPFYIVRQAPGAARPRNQAGELQKISDIWNAATAAGVANDQRWVQWYAASLEAGEPLDLPDFPTDEQTDKAELENHLLVAGDVPQVAYYDNPQIHIVSHRASQINAEMAGDAGAVERHEAHIQEHLAVARENAQRMAAEQTQQDAQNAVAQAQAAAPAQAPTAAPQGA